MNKHIVKWQEAWWRPSEEGQGDWGCQAREWEEAAVLQRACTSGYVAFEQRPEGEEGVGIWEMSVTGKCKCRWKGQGSAWSIFVTARNGQGQAGNRTYLKWLEFRDANENTASESENRMLKEHPVRGKLLPSLGLRMRCGGCVIGTPWEMGQEWGFLVETAGGGGCSHNPRIRLKQGGMGKNIPDLSSFGPLLSYWCLPLTESNTQPGCCLQDPAS